MAEVKATEVKGTKEILAQADAGLKLFKETEAVVGDMDAARAHKDDVDAKVKKLESEAEALTGKDNKKARNEKSKEAAAHKKTDQYIDAERVLKGLEPKHGHFVKSGGAAKPDAAVSEPTPEVSEPAAKDEAKAKKDDKKTKKVESAGISKAERDELEKLKNDIVARKAELKAEGKSGGQCNKDEQVVAMVTRMNELKEKECPGSTAAKDDKKDDKKGKKLSAEAAKETGDLERQIEEYRQKLTSEFGYSKKDINSDPDMVDMQNALKKLQGKK
jgi:hypothetical protein